MTENFVIKKLKRSKIKEADYNPRTMDDDTFKRLQDAISLHGLVQPIVVNQRTGHIVGGHQRVKALDIANENDYILTCAVVDVDEEEEKKLNIILNNKSLTGQWDFDKLEEIAKTMDLQTDSLGWTDTDIDILFGDFSSEFTDNSEVMEDKAFFDDVKKSELSDIKEKREKMKAEQKKMNDINYYFICICDSSAEKEDIYKRLGLSLDEEFVKLSQLKGVLKC